MKKFVLSFFGTAALAISCFAQMDAPRITVTIAGNGVAGFSGDNGPGKSAELNAPNDVCLDANNNVYFTDQSNGRIRVISAATGEVMTIAGGGTSTADGVPATSALLTPNFMCIDGMNNIYFTNGNEVKMLSNTGVVTTIAGSTTAGYGGDGGPAAAATFYTPQGICIDGTGNLYIADQGNNLIREIYAATGTIATIAGNGSMGYTGDGGAATLARLSSPTNISVDLFGNVYFADQNSAFPSGYNNSVMREISAATGNINTVIGSSAPTGATYGVPALTATIGTITGVCTDHNGDVYCNEMSCSCRSLKTTSDTLFIVGGNFGAQSYSDYLSSPMSNMDHPHGLCIDTKGTIYIADWANNRIRKLVYLTNTPAFAFGPAQTVNQCETYTYGLDTLLSIADIDSGVTETWSVVSGPSYGTLTGFPATATSNGVNMLSFPAGVNYVPTTVYSGTDFFTVSVSNGTNADTIKMYVNRSSSCPLSAANIAATITELSVFPNPANNQVTISSPVKLSNVVIGNIMGQEVYQTAGTENQMTLDISNYPAGIYFIKINDVSVKTFVKE